MEPTSSSLSPSSTPNFVKTPQEASSYKPVITFIALVALGFFVYGLNELTKNKKQPNRNPSTEPKIPTVSVQGACSTSSDVAPWIRSQPKPAYLEVNTIISLDAVSLELYDLFSETTQSCFMHVKELLSRQDVLFDKMLFTYAQNIMMTQPWETTRMEIRALDRYRDILPIRKTVVQVDGLEFNGNFVSLLKGQRFIATQAPHCYGQNPGNVMEILFWKCLVAQNVSGVFNLSNPNENCRSYTAASVSAPSVRTKTITDTALEDLSRTRGYSSNRHRVDIAGEGSREYTSVMVSKWIDAQGLPSDDLDALVCKQASVRQDSPADPILAHCRAGVGRTGVFMVACALKQIADLNLLTPENYKPVIIALVLSARAQRNRTTVQTLPQMMSIAAYARYLLKLEGQDSF